MKYIYIYNLLYKYVYIEVMNVIINDCLLLKICIILHLKINELI